MRTDAIQNPKAFLSQGRTQKPVDFFARSGYAARAAVYALMGTFALLVVLGFQGNLTDPQGSLRTLLTKPMGTAFLLILGIGLFCYAIWRVLQATFDYDHKGSGLKGVATRAGLFLGGLNHAILGYYAINLIFHLSRSPGGSGQSGIAGWLLSQPFGQVLAGIAALGVAGFGVGQIYIAIKEKFLKGLHLPSDKRGWLVKVCKFGLISRGVVFVIAGWLFMRAALYVNSSEAKGVKGVWGFLGDQQNGTALIGIIALGLIAFAVYGVAESLYRKTS